MSLVRCSQLLRRQNANFLNSLKNSSVFYSDDKKSPEDEKQIDSKTKTTEKNEKEPSKQAKNEKKIISSDSQNRLNDLLKKLSKRSSSLDVVRDVQTSKPIGYKQIRSNQKLDAKERKPRSISDAAKAVSQELGDEKIKHDILAPYAKPGWEDFGDLDDVISSMKSGASRKEIPKTGAFAADNTPRQNPGQRRRKPILQDARFEERVNRNQTEVVEKGVDLFGGKPIGIFESVEQLKVQQDPLKTWNKLEQHELRLQMSMAPRNYFEKMAYWTEEGKVWHFPIDNEQGLDEELKTSFTEHVFLEELLEPWCPKKGPIRNFMELVCIGLSKNPYLSVQQKHEHIEWYRQYFEEKRDILQRVIDENKAAKSQIADGASSS